MAIKIATFLWLLLMTFLSHIGGKTSGAESRWLSDMTGVNEKLLRQLAHVICFMVLAVLVLLSFPDTPLWLKVILLILWAVIDEASKALPIFQGRHCSIPEIGLNVLGVAIGAGIGILIGAV